MVINLLDHNYPYYENNFFTLDLQLYGLIITKQNLYTKLAIIYICFYWKFAGKLVLNTVCWKQKVILLNSFRLLWFVVADELPKGAWLVSKMGRLTAGVQYEPLCNILKQYYKFCLFNYYIDILNLMNLVFSCEDDFINSFLLKYIDKLCNILDAFRLNLFVL